MKIGVIGLGNMGSAIAQNLHKGGFDLVVYNRTRSKAEQFEQAGVPVAASARDLAGEVEVLFTMLSSDQALGMVLYEEDVLSAMKPGTIHVSMSTVSPRLIRQLSEDHERRGLILLSAPVFGRPDLAAQAQVWVVAAGEGEAVERCRPLLRSVGRGLSVVGSEPFKANVVKVAGNFLIAAMIEALGEAFSFVRKSGIPAADYLRIINEGLFRSPVYENYGGMIAEETYRPAAFKMSYGLKDIGLLLQEAERVEAPMPLGSLIHDHYLGGLAMGWEELDWAALAKVSSHMAGLEGK